jgi:hypothetical protein
MNSIIPGKLWIAHIDSVSHSDPQTIKVFPVFQYVYSVVPKVMHLTELVHAEVESYPTHCEQPILVRYLRSRRASIPKCARCPFS